MLNADSIRKQSDRLAASFEIPEFCGAIKIGGVPNYVVVYMMPVNMCADNKSIVALQKPLSKLIAYSVCFFWSDFSGLERLPYLVCNNIVFLLTPGNVFVAFL